MSNPLPSNPFSDDRLTKAEVFNPALDVPSVHHQVSTWLQSAIERAAHATTPDGNAKIAILRATPGYGKTHIMGRVGHSCAKDAFFVFVPQIEEHGSPVKHVHWYVVDALFEARPGKRPALHTLLARLCHKSFKDYFSSLPHTEKERHKVFRERLDEEADAVLDVIQATSETAPFLALADSIADSEPSLNAEIIRALVLGWSPRATEARRWLRGEDLEEAQLQALHLSDEPPTTSRLLETLAVLLRRLKLAFVLCCDQSEGMLRRPGAFEELTTSLMGWLDKIHNLVLVVTFLKDKWNSLNGFEAFLQRSQPLDLDKLEGKQAVELISRRLALWPEARPGKGPLWPFNENSIIRVVQQKPMDPRSLLNLCKAGFDSWLTKRTGKEVDIGPPAPPVDLKDLFRREWAQSLEGIRKEQLDPDNLQEERLFRSVREALDLLRQAGASVGGLDMLQIQEGALKKHLSLQLKLGRNGSASAIPVVVALTKLNGGNPMTAFMKALEEAVADPVVGAVLIRPSTQFTLKAKTVGREKYDSLKNSGKVRAFELTEHRPAFEQLECLVRFLDRAGQCKLDLQQQSITPDHCRKLVMETKVLDGLDLFNSVFCGWENGSTTAHISPQVKSEMFVAQTVGPIPLKTSDAQTSQPKAQSTTTLTRPEVPFPTEPNWAEKLLAAIVAKLTEFGQKVQALGVDIGPTFARLRVKPLGRTSIGKVRNHANDLRTHISGIGSVPVIADQPGYISVDVQRPDRQTVSLDECLRHPPTALEGQPAFPVGVDVTGKPFWLNLADPSTCHILTAGTTGSGKSEFLKSMLAGLAARLSPLELRFVLIDPKHVTFNFPKRSPYVLHPVAHTVDDAMPLVEQCFAETERRYAILEKLGLEHIGQLKGKDALPRIVVVFDEFADLMADKASRKELESSLKRIGALARAAGIHLVLATQRPDRDVVTPLLKANLPTRICLRVDGDKNSKIILGEEGGENLLGNGDLFWKHGGGMVRLQGAFVAKAELEALLRLD